MSKPIPHYQQVGSRHPITGQRREWRKGEPVMHAKGSRLNPRREVLVPFKRSHRLMTINDARGWLGWPDERLAKLRGPR